MPRNRLWTPEEDKILRGYVENRKGNLRTAFRAASKELNRTDHACELRWFVSNRKKREAQKPVLALFSLKIKKIWLQAIKRW